MTSDAGTFRSAEAGRDATVDCLVVGGGPAGASAAALLARRGRRVLVVERQSFPRHHVGESLIPETGRYLRAIGVYDRVAAAGFPVKRGAFLMAPDGVNARFARFADAEGVDDETTFEVRRELFDRILLDHARDCGAEVWEECRAREVELRPGAATVRVARTGEGGPGEVAVRCRYLLDASGRDGFLAKRLSLRTVDPQLRKVGVHAWYEGVVPPPEGHEGDLRIVSLAGDGWAWLIPLDEKVTSVGAVVSKERYAALPQTSAAERLSALLRTVPALAPLVEDARRVGEARIDGDYSYATRAYAGERWLQAGDAGSFLDPIFSTGVLLALASGVQAAEAVDTALGAEAAAEGAAEPAGARPPRAARRALAAYDREQRRVYRFFRRFVTRYERPELRDFLVSPAEVLGIGRAVTTVLAGNTRPRWPLRVRLWLFIFFIRLQRYVRIVPRLHGDRATTCGAPPEAVEAVPGTSTAF